jgi:hypothetical protein
VKKKPSSPPGLQKDESYEDIKVSHEPELKVTLEKMLALLRLRREAGRRRVAGGGRGGETWIVKRSQI